MRPRDVPGGDTIASRLQHPSEAGRSAQLSGLHPRLLRECDGFMKIGLGQFTLAQFQPQLSTQTR